VVLLLGLDTATPATTVALYDGQRVLSELTRVDARRHAELLGPAISEVLATAGATARDITAVAVGVGPGPYTGLRVGVATAAALGDALSIPVHGVCSLDVLAHQAGQGTPLTVVTDARRREVFWANYDGQGKRITGPAVSRPADAAALVTGRVVGPGALMYAGAFGNVFGPEQLSAGALCALVAAHLDRALPLLPVRPIYLRRPDTAAPAVAKRVLQA
jgi:tRNA threonylcarbamoyl adenosine modification protein YeaZ